MRFQSCKKGQVCLADKLIKSSAPLSIHGRFNYNSSQKAKNNDKEDSGTENWQKLLKVHLGYMVWLIPYQHLQFHCFVHPVQAYYHSVICFQLHDFSPYFYSGDWVTGHYFPKDLKTRSVYQWQVRSSSRHLFTQKTKGQ